jgi:glutathione S-transferase
MSGTRSAALRLFAGILIVAAGCGAARAQGAVEPVWSTRQWQTSTPEAQGMDSVALAKLLTFGVAASGHLAGDQFGFADINLKPILYRFRQAPEGAETLGAASHLTGYYERHAMRPSFVRTIPPPGVPGRTKPN